MLELLKSRRSIRKYKEFEVEKEKIDTILKCGLLSPSSKRINPWEFIVVTDKEKLSTLTNAKSHGSSFLHKSPLAIVVIGQKEKCDVWVEDLSISAIIIQLTAQKLGLGSCWIQIRERLTAEGKSSEDFVRKNLAIPDNYGVECIITLGYPDEVKTSYLEENLQYDKIHHEKF